jgi:hypothetical protein
MLWTVDRGLLARRSSAKEGGLFDYSPYSTKTTPLCFETPLSLNASIAK